MSPKACLVVMLGGAAGTLARYALSVWAGPLSRTLPWGTIGINVTGSFLIGLFGTLTAAHGRYPASDAVRLFVMVGFCGGYTTFSSFSLQTLDLLRAGAGARATINVLASVVLCVGAAAAGHLIAEQINGGPGTIARSAIEEQG